MELGIKDIARVEILIAFELFNKAYNEKCDLDTLRDNNIDTGLHYYFDCRTGEVLFSFISNLIRYSSISLGVDPFYPLPCTGMYNDLHEECILPRIRLLEEMIRQIDLN